LPSTSSDDFAAAATLPDPHVGPLHGVLSAKSTVVLGVLRNLILLHHLTEGSTISGSVLATNACFLCALSHLCSHCHDCIPAISVPHSRRPVAQCSCHPVSLRSTGLKTEEFESSFGGVFWCVRKRPAMATRGAPRMSIVCPHTSTKGIQRAMCATATLVARALCVTALLPNAFTFEGPATCWEGARAGKGQLALGSGLSGRRISRSAVVYHSEHAPLTLST